MTQSRKYEGFISVEFKKKNEPQTHSNQRHLGLDDADGLGEGLEHGRVVAQGVLHDAGQRGAVDPHQAEVHRIA